MDELPPKPIVPMMPPIGTNYAGFWRRFNAYGIDATIVWFIALIVGYLVLGDAFAQAPDEMQQLNDLITALQTGQVTPQVMDQVKASLMSSMTGGSVLGADTSIMIVVSAAYNTWFPVSDWQGTPGKHWLKMKIVMLDGSRLTPQQSVFRHIASAFSAVAWMLPCVTVFFSKDKLAPHDMLVGTRVIHRQR